MDKQRIYITGMGAVTPVGIGVPAYWEGLSSGRCGIGELPEYAELGLPVTRAARIRDFNARAFLPMRLVQDLEPFMQYAYISAEEALRESGVEGGDRVGIVMGSALSGLTVIADTAARYALSGRQAGPKFLTKAMGNIAAAHLSIDHGLTGPCMTVSTACSSGGDAVTTAVMLIRSGMADAVVVMAGEAAVCPELIQSLTKTGALSKTGESRPFDISRNGFVLGEGGGALVLESAEHAERRGARPLAEVLGCANNADAYNPVSPDPSGKGAAKCMELALRSGGILPEQVDYINAHGTATAMGDIAEARAIRAVFGRREVLVSSTKGATGHMMGAGGLTELIACVKAIETGILPVNLGFEQPDPDCGLNIVTVGSARRRTDVAVSNAFGFGGQNSCVAVGRV